MPVLQAVAAAAGALSKASSTVEALAQRHLRSRSAPHRERPLDRAIPERLLGAGPPAGPAAPKTPPKAKEGGAAPPEVWPPAPVSPKAPEVRPPEL
eukprot:13182231-Alexandrium_andersonii.AAC.1